MTVEQKTRRLKYMANSREADEKNERVLSVFLHLLRTAK